MHHSCTNVDQNILELILQNPNITVKQLSEALGLSERSVKTRMTLLKKEGIVIIEQDTGRLLVNEEIFKA